MASDSKNSHSINITHAIFDLDGLLLDTEPIYTQVTQSIIDRFGKVYTWELKSKVMGKVPLEAARTLLEGLGILGQITVEEFLAESEIKICKLFLDCPLMPGAEKLIRHLHSLGIPLALATSSRKYHVDLKLTKHQELFSLFETIVCGDNPEVKNGKPAPDIFQVTAKSFSSQPKAPENVIVFEDAMNGVFAGKAANMTVVWVPDKQNTSSCENADQIAESLDKVLLEQFGIKPFLF